mgnify:CR=1 FL=1
MTVTADTNGVAVVDLQSDKTVGPVRLSITARERTEIVELSFAHLRAKHPDMADEYQREHILFMTTKYRHRAPSD